MHQPAVRFDGDNDRVRGRACAPIPSIETGVTTRDLYVEPMVGGVLGTDLPGRGDFEREAPVPRASVSHTCTHECHCKARIYW